MNLIFKLIIMMNKEYRVTSNFQANLWRVIPTFRIDGPNDAWQRRTRPKNVN